MRDRRRFIILLLLAFAAVSFIACSQQKKETSEVVAQPKTMTQSGQMRVAFTYPVVMVNGKRGQKRENEYQDFVEIAFPENTEQNVELVVLDSEGNEQKINGQIKVFKYTSYSKPEGESGELVMVAPENAEYTYASIIRNGYGEFSIRENTVTSAKGETKGPILVQLILGTKKKK